MSLLPRLADSCVSPSTGAATYRKRCLASWLSAVETRLWNLPMMNAVEGSVVS